MPEPSNIKKFKYFDLGMQLLAIIAPWIWFGISSDGERLFYLNHLLISYLIVGPIQLCSALLNKLRLPAELRSRSRAWYEFSVLLVLGMMIIGYFTNALIIAFMLLLWTAPLLALWYVGLSLAEIRKLTKLNTPTNEESEETSTQ